MFNWTVYSLEVATFCLCIGLALIVCSSVLDKPLREKRYHDVTRFLGSMLLFAVVFAYTTAIPALVGLLL
jgi:hypothetical protein